MNTKEGLRRKRRRAEAQQRRLRHEMNNPSSDMILQRFKVQVLTAALHSFTVVATSPQEAANKVMAGQGGAEAGREGPTPIAAQVYPMALVNEKPMTLQAAVEKFVVDAVSQRQAMAAQGIPQEAAAPSLIQVVKE